MTTASSASGGTGKSFFALKMAVHIALGLPIIGAETKAGNVVYMSLEDSEKVVRKRIYHIFNSLPAEHQKIDKLTKKINIIDRHGSPTYMAQKKFGNIVEHPIADALSALLKTYETTCLFVDTFIRTNPLDENDNAEMGRLLAIYEEIATEAKCSIVLIHHIGKTESKSKNKNVKYSPRGASAIIDNARSALVLEKNEKEQIIVVKHAKYNYSDKYPDQYLNIAENGVLLEDSSTNLLAPPTSQPASLPVLDTYHAQKQLYKELYDWWVKDWGSKPLATSNIDDQNAKAIRQDAPSLGRGKQSYVKALKWGIAEGYAKKTAPEEGQSKKPDANFYSLKSLDEAQLIK